MSPMPIKTSRASKKKPIKSVTSGSSRFKKKTRKSGKKRPADFSKVRAAAIEPTLAHFEWNKDDPKDVETMTKLFIHNRWKGQRFFAVTKTGKLGKQLTEFDGTLGKMVLKPKPTVWERIRKAS